MRAGVYSDLRAGERQLLRMLRQYADVLLLKAHDPLHSFQTRLRTLWSYGFINLSLGKATQLNALQKKQRSLVAKLREARKKINRQQQYLGAHMKRADEAESELENIKSCLVRAHEQLARFKAAHPDWKPPPDQELQPADHADACEIFRQVDQEIDNEKMLKHDPSGFLTTFWQEQRRILRTPSARARRWNPQVVMIGISHALCVYVNIMYSSYINVCNSECHIMIVQVPVVRYLCE